MAGGAISSKQPVCHERIPDNCHNDFCSLLAEVHHFTSAECDAFFEQLLVLVCQALPASHKIQYGLIQLITPDTLDTHSQISSKQAWACLCKSAIVYSRKRLIPLAV